MSASLADQDVAGQNELTVGTLDTEALGLGIAAVLGGANAFLWAKNCIFSFSIFYTSEMVTCTVPG